MHTKKDCYLPSSIHDALVQTLGAVASIVGLSLVFKGREKIPK